MTTFPVRSLPFNGHQMLITDINGVPWLRGDQIRASLMLPPTTYKRILKNHRVEFTPDMTATIEIDTGGGRQLTRLFSPRGAALMALLAKSEPAAAFRVWVLNALEAPPALPVPIAASPSVEALLAPQAKAALRYARLGLTSGEIGRLLDLKGTATRSLLRRLRAAQLLPVAGVSHHG